MYASAILYVQEVLTQLIQHFTIQNGSRILGLTVEYYNDFLVKYDETLDKVGGEGSQVGHLKQAKNCFLEQSKENTTN